MRHAIVFATPCRPKLGYRRGRTPRKGRLMCFWCFDGGGGGGGVPCGVQASNLSVRYGIIENANPTPQVKTTLK